MLCPCDSPSKNTGVDCHVSRGSSNPGIETVAPVTPESQVDSVPLSHWGSPLSFLQHHKSPLVYFIHVYIYLFIIFYSHHSFLNLSLSFWDHYLFLEYILYEFFSSRILGSNSSCTFICRRLLFALIYEDNFFFFGWWGIKIIDW